MCAAYAKVMGQIVRSKVFYIICLYVRDYFLNNFEGVPGFALSNQKVCQEHIKRTGNFIFHI